MKNKRIKTMKKYILYFLFVLMILGGLCLSIIIMLNFKNQDFYKSGDEGCVKLLDFLEESKKIELCFLIADDSEKCILNQCNKIIKDFIK